MTLFEIQAKVSKTMILIFDMVLLRAVTVADFYHRGGKWTNYRRWRGVVHIYIYLYI